VVREGLIALESPAQAAPWELLWFFVLPRGECRLRVEWLFLPWQFSNATNQAFPPTLVNLA
jgi:hypothetical protein